MAGYHGPIDSLTKQNTNFRQVLFTAPHSQLVLMSLLPQEEIGLEMHDVDQFFRFEQGQGTVVIGDNSFEVKDGDAVVIPAGSYHNITNTSATESLKLYTIYSPAHHPDGTVHKTKAEAEASE